MPLGLRRVTSPGFRSAPAIGVLITAPADAVRAELGELVFARDGGVPEPSRAWLEAAKTPTPARGAPVKIGSVLALIASSEEGVVQIQPGGRGALHESPPGRSPSPVAPGVGCAHPRTGHRVDENPA